MLDGFTLLGSVCFKSSAFLMSCLSINCSSSLSVNMLNRFSIVGMSPESVRGGLGIKVVGVLSGTKWP